MLIKIQFGLSLIIVIILAILPFAARAAEGERRKGVTEMHSRIELHEKKLDAIHGALPPSRR